MSEIIRVGKPDDLSEVMEIIQEAKDYLAAQGIDQWQNGYPDEFQIQKDLATKDSYVLKVNGITTGFAFLNIGIDEAYEAITDGSWEKVDGQYAAIHRLAVSNAFRGRGLSKKFMALLIEELENRGINDIRIDTHKDNVIVQKLARGLGFEYKGQVIYEGPRMAFQLVK
ncbi:MAG: GNAT family N-acetyltransferase [Lactobacillaceae bacterium]|jgi:ribosomal protein S18 acetylase RimI-like enzyme|nr:GNAT family N-acetyltransferase [Lactobacillaceae bacterium]